MTGLKLLIAGGRDYDDQRQFDAAMAEFIGMYSVPSVIICGMCETGADAMAVNWAEKSGIPVDEHPAEWDKYGNAAGPIRNKEMAPLCDRALIFWDAKSRGTKSMIKELVDVKKSYHVWYYNIKGNG